MPEILIHKGPGASEPDLHPEGCKLALSPAARCPPPAWRGVWKRLAAGSQHGPPSPPPGSCSPCPELPAGSQAEEETRPL
jgi:hypothetical protein